MALLDQLSVPDPEQFQELLEQQRQERFEDRIVERILRLGGFQAPYIKHYRYQAGGKFDFVWFNQEACFPAVLSARKLTKGSTFVEDVSNMMGKSFTKCEMFMCYKDTADMAGDHSNIGFIFRHKWPARDLIFHTCKFSAYPESEFRIIRRFEGIEYVLQPLDDFLGAAVVDWDVDNLSHMEIGGP